MHMHPALQFPFDTQMILIKRRSIKKELLAAGGFIEKRIAILGGSTTHDIKEILELFLLDYGIKPAFYESEFGMYWQDAMFGNPQLDAFRPDIIFIHTSSRNITAFPAVRDSAEKIDALLEGQAGRFTAMWDRLFEKYNCAIIQNNFELPYFRLLGNMEASNIHGRINFISRLNELFYSYARTHSNFFINDINYLSASYGLEKWSNPLYWHMYKYALCVPAIPLLAHNVAKIIRSIYGKNKKALVLDLDNTLWGGVVGDDGVEGIEIGRETPLGEAYREFQEYIKAHKDLGVMLCVSSKNDPDNAVAGLNHPEGCLKPEDFLIIKANWESKDANVREIASELNILPDSLVFVDDNPAERAIVKAQVPGAAVPEIDRVENYIHILDGSGFFEMTSLSEEDMRRNEMYMSNLERARQEKSFDSYEDYLRSLEMTAEIRDFDEIYLQRITQLANKTNQFNLTTRRYSQSEIEEVARDGRYIRLYGKLRDKYGDSGVVTVVIGRKEGKVLHIELWLMSCRVLKRNLEHAMMDVLVEEAAKAGIEKIMGYYYRTEKNGMVRDFYGEMGFTKTAQNGEDSVWELDARAYKNQNRVIKIQRESE
ncbi:MAG: HAD-IIIC family phosphatase [Oscillospiraceae bacterium]|jgi:FkbH-like protein